ncbi:MAG TPA: threonine synthase [Symbiobacteriaceae bacterium]|nr:threonine synthase [Symbiobacteriaceae bacterium]
MQYVKHLECVLCGKTYPASPTATTCPACGPTGILDVVFDYDAIARHEDRETVAVRSGQGLWCWAPLLPVAPDGPRGPLLPGNTPLVAAPRLAEALGVGQLWLKDEGRAPTASLKDRASAIGVAKAMEVGAKVVATASTGNAASSLAGACAAAGLRSVIFVPQTAAEGKVAQLLIFGATVFQVQGSYADAFALATAAIAEQKGWYNRLSGINPYLVEGKKTCGLEVALDLGWQVPDWVVVSVGDGCTVAGIARAFIELARIGWTDRVPRILGVQAEGSRAVADAFFGSRYAPGGEETIADGIAVGEPRNWVKAVTRIKATGGTFTLVTDNEIREAMGLTGRLTGVFAEPAAGAAVAGLQKAVVQGIIGKSDSVAVVVSGSGLKDVRRAIEAAGAPIRVQPSMAEVWKALPADMRE